MKVVISIICIAICFAMLGCITPTYEHRYDYELIYHHKRYINHYSQPYKYGRLNHRNSVYRHR